MSIQVSCPECFMEYSVPERFAGRKIKCKSCGAAIPVPHAVEAIEDDEFGDLGGPAFSPSSLPPRPDQIRRSRPAAAKVKGSKGKRSPWVWVGGIAAGLVLAVLVCCGGPALLFQRALNKVDVGAYPDLPDFGEPTALFPVAQIPVPKFPALGAATPAGESGVQTYNIDLASVAGNEGSPGMKMSMRVYLPAGEHAARSVPCLLIAPAGTTLLEGVSLDDGEYFDETLPYAEAGMAVIHYSLDGGDEIFDDENASLKAPYLHFRAACAGVVNARNALEFALAKLPTVDPKKIYTAGHSSAGTLALLAAEHEPRLAGAIAYAPAADVEARLKELTDVPLLAGLMAPRAKEFATQSSPTTHLAELKCPVFLFHSKSDQNVPFAESEQFATKLRAAGKDVTLEVHENGADEAQEPAEANVDADADRDQDAWEEEDWEEYDDGHYGPMISDGIPKAIEWLKARNGL